VSLAGIILAAGASRRMGRPKALLEFEGETFLDRLIGLLAAECAPVLVVLGYGGDEIRAGLRRARQAQILWNPAPERGQFSSLQCALAAVPAQAEGFLFTPVDYPAVRPQTLAALVRTFRAQRPIALAPRYRGRSGHPVCCAPALAAEMLREPADSQARAVLRRHQAEILYLEVDDPGVAEDADDPEAYRRLRDRAR
jgi:molybdenum cofactor cytidylyltransferase